MRPHADESLRAEILDLLLMAPESTESLATMLDETTVRRLLGSHPSVRSGTDDAVGTLEQEGLIRPSVHFRDVWELTDRGTSTARGHARATDGG